MISEELLQSKIAMPIILYRTTWHCDLLCLDFLVNCYHLTMLIKSNLSINPIRELPGMSMQYAW